MINDDKNYNNPSINRIKKIINNDKESEHKKITKIAHEYYKNNSDILKRKRMSADGSEEKILSNSKHPHPIFAKLVKQKVSYLLSKPLSIQTNDNKCTDVLHGYFDSGLFKTLKKLGTEAIICGCAWLQVHYDDDGKMKFSCIPTTELIPLWEDGGKTTLKAMVRYYSVDEPLFYDNPQTYIEYYSDDIAIKFRADGGNIVEQARGGHIKIIDGTETKEASFGRIPFIPFRYNSDEIPLLSYVKLLLDDYDFLSSEISNNIKDTPNAIKIIKGYAPSLAEFNKNLATYRAVIVNEGGAIEQLLTPIDTVSCEAQLTRLRKDIYDAGFGVDAQEVSQGNTSGVAIRLRYADLDMDCQSMATEFSSALNELLYFIALDAHSKKLCNFDNVDVSFIFNTDIAINEAETIAACQQSQGIISRETIVANHPWVTNTTEEIERLEKIDEYEDMRVDDGE